jgi:hypothetical protein
MQAFAFFKVDEMAPVSYMANVKGKGIRHIQDLAYRFADDNGLGYWHITYHQGRGTICQQSRPSIRAPFTRNKINPPVQSFGPFLGPFFVLLTAPCGVA